ncbi:MAG: hypothetical protein ACRDT4_17420 [Micromonosporaceae bacterium]
MSGTSYAALARRLDAARRDELALTAGQRQEAESGRAALHELVDQLTGQQTDLTQAASLLRVRMPLIDPPPSSALTAGEALSAARAAAERSDSERLAAVERAHAPRFLPGASTVVRNAAVYAICAAAAVMVSSIMEFAIGDSDPTTVMLWSLLGLPMVAFFVGYLLIGVVCVPRIPPSPPEKDQHGLPLPAEQRLVPQLRRSPRLGATICLLFGPVVWLVLVVL